MRQVRTKQLKHGLAGLCVVLALALSVAGCGGDDTPVEVPLQLTLAPASVSALVGSFVQFSLGVNGNVDTVSFLVNDVAHGNTTVGTITDDGLYQAPAVVPANTKITVKVKAGDSAAGTSAEVTATVTLDSGVRVSMLSGSKFTIGTGETYPFAASVIGVPTTASVSGVCDSVTNTPVSCSAVTWSVSGIGSIDSASGLYTAPSAVTTATATITATSVYDTTRNATATVTIVTAADPTLTSISNIRGAAGAIFQDVYLTGSNFISTTNVFFDGIAIPTSQIVLGSSTLLRTRVPDFRLITPGTFAFTVARQVGTPQPCADPTQCQITLSAVRPAIVGSTPDAVRQPNGSTPAVDVSVNGGYFGTNGSPSVTAQYGGQSRAATVNSARQLSVTIGGAGNPGDLNTPGLFPLAIRNPGASQPQATTNVAIQPTYPASVVTSLGSLPAGTAPSAVAINTATGIAVVANRDTNSVALIDLTTVTPLGFICTANASATLLASDAGCPAGARPVSVAVDNLRNIALVANSGTGTTTCVGCSVAVVNLLTRVVDSIISIPGGSAGITKVPSGIGINPLSGLAIVAYQSTNFASVIDVKLSPPAVTGLVKVATGVGPRVAVSPKLNWAIVTPGDTGSSVGAVSLVDLSRQNRNTIVSAICSGTTVTVSTATPHTLSQGDSVLILGNTGTATNGVFSVVSAPGSNTFTYTSGCANGTTGNGGMANYAPFLASVALSTSVTGAAFNDETQKVILVDPTGPQAFLFSALDQTSSTVPPGLNLVGNVAGAFNPLADIAVTVNRLTNNAAVIDPVTPAILTTFSVGTEPIDVAIDPGTNTAVIANRTSNNVSIFSLGVQRTPQILQVSREDNKQGPEVEITSTLASPATASDKTLRVIGSGFINGTSVARLDGVSLATNVLSSRELTAIVPAATLAAGPRLYALDVVNGVATSNAAAFTVVQSVDVSSLGCAPQGVGIDTRRNLAVVTNSGCNAAAIINLPGATGATGMGQTVAVGTNPQGVAVDLQSGLAIVANHDSNNASIVNVATGTVVATIKTDVGPIGVAIDSALGLAVVTANDSNFLDTFAVSSSDGTVATSFAAVQQRPVAVAVDPERHFAAVANTTSNSVSLVDLTKAVATEHIGANGQPAGIAFDPVSNLFLVESSLLNQLLVLDPISRSTTALRVGINPTSIAYNFNSSTVVTTNSSSQTMSVMDFVSGRVRAVISLRASGRFAVDIHPFTNLAVIADSAGNRVLLRPLPR